MREMIFKKIATFLKNIYSEKLVFLLFLLSTADLIFSYIGLELGYIEEANPIMKQIYLFSGFLFCFFKLTVTILSTIIIGYGYKKYKWVKKVVFLPIAVYIIIMAMHFYFSTVIAFTGQ